MSDESGFTLLEVMVALAIMAGVILTVINSFNYNLSVVNRDKEETIAVILGRAKLDDPNYKPVDGANGSFAPDWPDITWSTQVMSTDYQGVNRVVFTVSWNEKKRKIDLVQYVAK